MIERKFVAEKIKEHLIQRHIMDSLSNVGHSHTKLQKTPLGEKIIIFASRPGLIVGRKGENIKKLTKALKKKFALENPQIEINEIEKVHLDASIVAERIASTLERFGPQKFKGISHKTMSDVMRAHALGVEILISGKIPSSRARRWRFYTGYLKKCGDIALTGVNTAYRVAKLKTGIVGIQVRIMGPDVVLPDNITLLDNVVMEEEVIEEPKKKVTKKKAKKTTKKKAAKKEASADKKKAEAAAAESKPIEEESTEKQKEKPKETEDKK